MIGDRRMQVRALRHMRQGGKLERHDGDHPLREIAHRRLHDRIVLQLRVGFQFRHVLVLEGEAVRQELGRVLAFGDIVLDHRPPAARIA